MNDSEFAKWLLSFPTQTSMPVELQREAMAAGLYAFSGSTIKDIHPLAEECYVEADRLLRGAVEPSESGQQDSDS